MKTARLAIDTLPGGDLRVTYPSGVIEVFEDLPAGVTTGVLVHYDGKWYRKRVVDN